MSEELQTSQLNFVVLQYTQNIMNEDKSFFIKTSGKKELLNALFVLKSLIASGRVIVESIQITKNASQDDDKALTTCQIDVKILKQQLHLPESGFEEALKQTHLLLHKKKWTDRNDVSNSILAVMKQLGDHRQAHVVVSHPEKMLCALQMVKTIQSWQIPSLDIQNPKVYVVNGKKDDQTFIYLTVNLSYFE